MAITFNIYDLMLETNVTEAQAIKIAKGLLENGITRKIGKMHYEVIDSTSDDIGLYQDEDKFYSIIRESLKNGNY